MSGLFNLNDAHGLREKLRRDLAKMKAEPLNADAAFNFFITAEHMLDWVYPTKANKQKRTDAKKASTLLRVTSHLANGAKHFEVESLHHDSVTQTGLGGGIFPPQLYPQSLFPNALFGAGRRLVVTLRGEAAKELGQIVGVAELADKILDFWDNHPLT